MGRAEAWERWSTVIGLLVGPRVPRAAGQRFQLTTGSTTKHLHPQTYFFLITVNSCDLVWTKKPDTAMGSYWRNWDPRSFSISSALSVSVQDCKRHFTAVNFPALWSHGSVKVLGWQPEQSLGREWLASGAKRNPLECFSGKTLLPQDFDLQVLDRERVLKAAVPTVDLFSCTSQALICILLGAPSKAHKHLHSPHYGGNTML